MKIHLHQKQRLGLRSHTQNNEIFLLHDALWRASCPVQSPYRELVQPDDQLYVTSPLTRGLAQFRQPTTQSSSLDRGLAPTRWPRCFPLVSYSLQPILALSAKVWSGAPCVGWPLDTTSIGSKHPCYRCARGGGVYLGSTPLDPWLLFDLRLNLGALSGPEVVNWGQLPSYLASFVGPESASKP